MARWSSLQERFIAIADSYEGKFCRAFPMYGSARRGASIPDFAHIGDESEAT